jgi:hypothetical protein
MRVSKDARLAAGLPVPRHAALVDPNVDPLLGDGICRREPEDAGADHPDSRCLCHAVTISLWRPPRVRRVGLVDQPTRQNRPTSAIAKPAGLLEVVDDASRPPARIELGEETMVLR